MTVLLRWPATLSAAGLLAVTACTAGVGDARESERTERAVRAARVTAGRLSGQSAWAPCVATDTTAIAGRYACGPVIDAAATALHPPPASDTSAPAIHLRALIDLRLGDGTRASTARVVSAMEHAAVRAPTDARVWNDLAVAYMALAEHDQTLVSMLDALDAIEHSVQIDSGNAEARFNRALAYERLHLDGSARPAWLAYLAADTNRAWKADARRHLASLPRTADTDGLERLRTTLDAPPDLATRVARSPLLARELGSDLLREWGVSISKGDGRRATRVLALARAIGGVLALAGDDEGLARTVHAIDGLSPDTEALRRAAIASADLGTGIQLYNRLSSDSAATILDRARRELRALGLSSAVGWADYYFGAARVSLGDYAAGDSAFMRVMRATPPREPALLGKTMLALGVSQIRRGNYDAAIRWYRDALPVVAASHEALNIGFSTFLLAEALGRAGLKEERDEQAFRALRLLAPFRRSNHLSNQLTQIGAEARARGLRRAALAITSEMLDIAQQTKQADVMALAYCARARDFAAVGRLDDADADLVQADRWSQRMPAIRGFDRIRGAVLLARGEIQRGRDPQKALPILRRAVAVFKTFERDRFLPESQYQAAEAARDAGRVDEARELLADAIRNVEQQESSFRSDEGRIAFAETTERIFDAIISLEGRAYRASVALDYLERARAITWSPASRAAAAISAPAAGAMERMAARIPKGELVVEYGVLRDRLLIWSIGPDAQRFLDIPVSRDSLASLVNGVTSASSDSRTDTQRIRLFEFLLAPIAKELAGARSVTVVPDRELYRVPFAALVDERTHRYAVEQTTFRVAPSTAFYLDAERVNGVTDASARILAIGNPLSSTSRGAGYPELPGADIEARAVGRLYSSSLVLTGNDATRVRFLELAPTSGVVHFAGHAVMDADRPSRSYLMFADDGVTSGVVEAREIATLRLPAVRLVVLSACSTVNARASHAGGITGLAYSFLRAGVPATVSTLWDINDQSSTPVLVDFHNELVRGTPAAEALRRAQLRALHSTMPELRDPRVWGAFTYTGP